MTDMNMINAKIHAIVCDNSEAVKLNPVFTIESVRELERMYGVELPDSYVSFITQIGDGGQVTLFTNSTNTLIPLGRYEILGYSFDRLKRPFKLKKSWVNDENEKKWDMVSYDGHIVITDDSTCNNMQWILIVTGPCKGELWLRSEFGVLRTDCDFITWLGLHLDGKLDQYLIDFKKKEQEPILTPLEMCQKDLIKNHIRLNPTIAMVKVKMFEERHRVLLPVEYVQLVTEIGDGSAKLPWYITKIYSLFENDCLDDLAQPFLFQNQEDIQTYLMHEKNGKMIHKWFNKRDSVWSHICDDQVDFATKGTWLLPEFQTLHGCMPLILVDYQNGCNKRKLQYALILNGDFKGEVWCFNEYDIYPGHSDAGARQDALNCFNDF